MIAKRIATAAICCGLVMGPAQRAVADGGDFALGIAAGVIGSAVVRDIQKKNQAKKQQQQQVQPSGTTSAKASSGMSEATRAANKEVQTALNYFAFPVGTPDGVLGRKSRAGISQFQALMGYPVTGELAPYERDFLVSSYYRAQAGGAATQQAIVTNPQGVQGLLVAWAAGGAAATVAAPAPAPAPAPAAGKVPTFTVQAGAAKPLSGWCAEVQGANAGVVPVSGDPNAILAGQFCSARAQTIAESEALMAQVAGFTPEQIAAQCRDFGPLLGDYVTALGQAPEAQVLERVSGWTLASGIAPDNLAGTARVCLGSGYRDDDMTVAIGSALVLSALGQTGYAELPGHHLVQGFGVPRRPDLALEWFDAAVAAPVAVFSDGDPARLQSLQRAASVVGGRADAGQVPAFATQGASVTKTAASP